MNLNYEIAFTLAKNGNQPQTPAQIADEILKTIDQTIDLTHEAEAVKGVIETTLDTLCLFGMYTTPAPGTYALTDIWYASLTPCEGCRIREEHYAILRHLRGGRA